MSVQKESPEPPAYLQEPRTQPIEDIFYVVWERLNLLNEHFMGVIVGREGSGKSMSCIKIAQLVDPEFTAEQIFFHPEELLRLLRDEDFRPGAVYVLDEAGVSFGNRSWYDEAQIKVNKALQLIRSHNIGLIFSLPRLGELDSQTEGRLQAVLELTEKQDGEYVAGSWLWKDPDRRNKTGKVYEHYPRTDRGERVTRIELTPPSQKIIEPYEEQKKQFQREVYDDAIGELEADEEDKLTKPKDIARDILDEEGVRPFLKEINNGTQTVLDKDLIAAEYEIGRRKAKQVKKLVAKELDIDVI